LIVRLPGARANGKSTRSITEFVDLYPTLAELCGIKVVSSRLEGKSFKPVFADPTYEHKKAAVTVVKRGQRLGRSIRNDRFRYTEWDGPKPELELYDHLNDPGEWVNLASQASYAELIRKLSGTIKAIEARKEP
jgi:uncharacterized sulfatase